MRPVIFLFLLSATHVSAATAHDKPNVVVFFMDDMGYGDCRAYNPESKVALPTLKASQHKVCDLRMHTARLLFVRLLVTVS